MQKEASIDDLCEENLTFEENQTKRNEIIQQIASTMKDLEHDLVTVTSNVAKELIEKELIHHKRQLSVAQKCENIVEIQRQIKFYQLNSIRKKA